MFKPRLTVPVANYRDPAKLYTISANGKPVEHRSYTERLAQVKHDKGIGPTIPAFAIFHDGATLKYLVLGWWKNGNELFVSVSVREDAGWVQDANRYSFCIWDMQIMRHERNSFIRHMYSGTENLEAYRSDLKHG